MYKYTCSHFLLVILIHDMLFSPLSARRFVCCSCGQADIFIHLHVFPSCTLNHHRACIKYVNQVVTHIVKRKTRRLHILPSTHICSHLLGSQQPGVVRISNVDLCSSCFSICCRREKEKKRKCVMGMERRRSMEVRAGSRSPPASSYIHSVYSARG